MIIAVQTIWGTIAAKIEVSVGTLKPGWGNPSVGKEINNSSVLFLQLQ